MTEPITLRIATPADADTLARLHAESWKTAYRGILPDAYLDHEVDADRLALWTARMPSLGEGRAWLAEQGEEPVGFVCVLPDKEATWGPLIDNLHVRPSRRGAGIGVVMLETVWQWLRERGEQRVHLWVFEDNQAARRFYDRMGGKPVEWTLQMAPGGVQRAEVRYVWTL